MGHLEIKHLKMVQTISRTGTMTRAAQALFLSQSAVSQQLKEIETKLNTPLFYRTKKKMVPTPMGIKVLNAAEIVIHTLEDTETDIARMVTKETGELKVGTQCIFCYRWLPEVLGQFQEKFVNVDLEIGNCVDVFHDLENADFHLVISVAPEPLDRVVKVPLFRDELVAILHPDHALARKNHIELTDFKDEKFISIWPMPRNRFFQKVLKPAGILPKRFLVVEDPAATMEIAAAGFGIAMAPAWAVRPLVEKGRLKTLSVTRAGQFLTWYAVFLKNDPYPVFMKEFIRLVGRAGIASPPEQGTRSGI